MDNPYIKNDSSLRQSFTGNLGRIAPEEDKHIDGAEKIEVIEITDSIKNSPPKANQEKVHDHVLIKYSQADFSELKGLETLARPKSVGIKKQGVLGKIADLLAGLLGKAKNTRLLGHQLNAALFKQHCLEFARSRENQDPVLGLIENNSPEELEESFATLLKEQNDHLKDWELATLAGSMREAFVGAVGPNAGKEHPNVQRAYFQSIEPKARKVIAKMEAGGGIYQDALQYTKRPREITVGHLVNRLPAKDRRLFLEYQQLAGKLINSTAGGQKTNELQNIASNFTRVQSIGTGENGARILYDDNKKPYFAKPLNAGKIFTGVEDGLNMGLKEATASAIDKQLGFNLVPDTVFLHMDHEDENGKTTKGLYSISEYVGFTELRKFPRETLRVPEEQRVQGAVLDYLLNSQDRHEFNLGIKTVQDENSGRNEQHLVMYDNGYSQPEQLIHGKVWMNSTVLHQGETVRWPATFTLLDDDVKIGDTVKNQVRDRLTDEFIDRLPLPEDSRKMIRQRRDSLMDMATFGELKASWMASTIEY